METLLKLIGFIGELIVIPLGIYFGTTHRNKILRWNSKTNPCDVVFIWGLIMLSLECVKQMMLYIELGYFDINRIPFQLCSTPMYIALLFPLLKEKFRTKYASITYMAFISFEAAFFFFFSPKVIIDTPYFFIKIHSYIWHWSLLGMGTYVMCVYDTLGFDKEHIFNLIRGFVVFVILTLIACCVNELYKVFATMYTNDSYDGLNFYYLRSGCDNVYPILKNWFPQNRPYVLSVLSFIVYFAIGTTCIYSLCCGIKRLVIAIENLIVKFLLYLLKDL